MNTIHANRVEDIVQSIIINAPAKSVWTKISTADGISSWFMPNDFQPIVGHKFHIQSQFGPSPCEVLEIEEFKKIVFSWDTDGWIVTFSIKDLGDKSEFTVIHGGWKDYDSIVPKAKTKVSEVYDNMNSGWEGLVNRLAGMLM